MILNVAFYKFVELDGLPELRLRLRERLRALGVKGTILLSAEGINASLAGPEAAVRAALEFLAEADPRISGFSLKESRSETVPFGRMLVKLKKEIIPMGRPDVLPSRETGKRLEPAELKRWLDERRDIVVLDTRNRYEIEQGTFEGARDLGLRHFRHFPEELRKLPEADRRKTVVMFCTGGIRCEKATALALREGFRDVYQLEGGILRYFEECGGSHFRGKCFVFDERVALDSELKP